MKYKIKEDYGALLHMPWMPDPKTNTGIIGQWAEDYSEYCFHVPEQLRDMFVDMQNRLHNLRQSDMFNINLYRQALTKAVSLPAHELPSSEQYYTLMLNGNVLVFKEKNK